jgi:aspartyl-tRNA(Asn)/glutamyl-tRNA(Gln) amidotransferase subunit B
VAAELPAGRVPDPDAFVRLLRMESEGELTPAQSRAVLRALVVEGGDPVAIAAKLGYQAMAAGALDAVVDQVVAANLVEWERYTGGDDRLAGFLIGKVKAATGGNADLRAAAALLQQRRAAARGS